MGKGKWLWRETLPGFRDQEASLAGLMDEKGIGRRIAGQWILLSLLALEYGIVMGSYNGAAQAFSSGIKMPVLMSLLMLICFPAFYAIQSALGSRLSPPQMASILLSGFLHTAAIMASFSTIVLFFMITGGDYAFLQLLHVAVIGVAGLFGMRHVVGALTHACEKKKVYPKIGILVFRFWIVILFFVGSQLSWSLRPFIGVKDMPFQVFREQEGNFYEALAGSAAGLFRGDAAAPVRRTVPAYPPADGRGNR